MIVPFPSMDSTAKESLESSIRSFMLASPRPRFVLSRDCLLQMEAPPVVFNQKFHPTINFPQAQA